MISKPAWAFFHCLLGVGTMSVACMAIAAQEVRIGAVHFPPYTIRPEKGEDTGLLPDLAAALNAAQSLYHFVLVPTSIPRRFQDFRQGRIDMALFENPEWDWQTTPYASVDMGLEDAEVFVGLQAPGRDQHYFADLAGKRLALYSGYHYAFAQFNADPEYLASHYDATLTYSHDSNLMMVARDRADIALITRSYLTSFLQAHAEVADRYLISERVDQRYHHFALIRPQAAITPDAFGRLLQQLRDNGELVRIFKPYQIDVLPMPAEPVVARHRAPPA